MSCVRSGEPGASFMRPRPAFVPATVSRSPVIGLTRVRLPDLLLLPLFPLPMADKVSRSHSRIREVDRVMDVKAALADLTSHHVTPRLVIDGRRG